MLEVPYVMVSSRNNTITPFEGFVAQTASQMMASPPVDQWPDENNVIVLTYRGTVRPGTSGGVPRHCHRNRQRLQPLLCAPHSGWKWWVDCYQAISPLLFNIWPLWAGKWPDIKQQLANCLVTVWEGKCIYSSTMDPGNFTPEVARSVC